MHGNGSTEGYGVSPKPQNIIPMNSLDLHWTTTSITQTQTTSNFTQDKRKTILKKMSGTELLTWLVWTKKKLQESEDDDV